MKDGFTCNVVSHWLGAHTKWPLHISVCEHGHHSFRQWLALGIYLNHRCRQTNVMESLIKNISINVLENVVGNKTGPRIETLVRSSLLAQFQHILNTYFEHNALFCLVYTGTTSITTFCEIHFHEWKKNVSWFEFHWSSFLRVQLTIFHHRFR